MIDGGECGRERLDIMWDCGTHRLILEVDEDNGHKSRQELCECTRMVNISQSNGMPTVFLRYNPDSFLRDGKKSDVRISKRRDTLLGWVAHLKATPPTHFLSMMQLYYEDHRDEDVSLHCILPFESATGNEGGASMDVDGGLSLMY
eukprot:52388-Eustigmatos_ZCMA.PRE.1